MYQKIFKKILELSKAGYEVSIHSGGFGYVLSIRDICWGERSIPKGVVGRRNCWHVISYDEIEFIGTQVYLPFIKGLNAMIDKMDINDIERLDPDLGWDDFQTFS